MEQVTRIELASQPWQGRVLTIVLHLQWIHIHYIIKNIKVYLKIEKNEKNVVQWLW